MAHIVILGAGTGGMPAAYELREELGSEHEVTVVNEREYFQFVPSNPWVAVGWRDRNSITFDIRPHLERKGINFLAKRCDKIDAAGNALHFDDGETLNYDYLVIATGPRLAFEEVEGAGPETGNTASVCTVDHAEAAYEEYKSLLDDPGHVVVGAMPFASCFGPAYEFAFIMDADLRKRKMRDRVPMTFITSEPYIGHLGLGGVGDSQGMLESEMRNHHMKWITNAKVTKVEDGKMHVEEYDNAGHKIKDHEVAFKFSMMLPAFKGVDAVMNVEGLCNPRGFVFVDDYQRNPTYKNIYSAGVCIAIPPVEATAVPTGAPKTGYMIESMVTATTHNIVNLLKGGEPDEQGSWNAVCLADFGDTGVAFVALPQIPPRNTNWASRGKWVHLAKIAYEKYFLHKVRAAKTEPYYEKTIMKLIGVERLKESR